MRPNIELHIEELVLHGFAPGDRHHIGAAVERSLGQLLAEHDVAPALMDLGDVSRLDAGKFDVASRAQPDAIGAQVARSVFRGLTR